MTRDPTVALVGGFMCGFCWWVRSTYVHFHESLRPKPHVHPRRRVSVSSVTFFPVITRSGPRTEYREWGLFQTTKFYLGDSVRKQINGFFTNNS